MHAPPPRRPRTFTALGRQAIALIARQMVREGRRTVIVPTYSCLTMIVPWQLEGMRIEQVACDPVMMDPADLERALAKCSADETVVFYCETFGCQPSRALSDVLGETRGRGVRVVADRTHSVLCDSVCAADMELVSARKLLSIPEIAWVDGTVDQPFRRSEADNALTRARQQFLSTPSVATFEAVEDLADELSTPVSPSQDAMTALEAVDMAGLRADVRRTRTRVEEGLPPGCTVVNEGVCAPLVVRTNHAGKAADALYSRGIVGPIHWDRPASSRLEWPSDLLCLPLVMTPDQCDQCIEVLTAIHS